VTEQIYYARTYIIQEISFSEYLAFNFKTIFGKMKPCAVRFKKMRKGREKTLEICELLDGIFNWWYFLQHLQVIW